MNQKTCKQLRSLARARSIGMQERRLIAVRQGKKGAVSAVNDPETTRGIYRQLKREHAL